MRLDLQIQFLNLDNLELEIKLDFKYAHEIQHRKANSTKLMTQW